MSKKTNTYPLSDQTARKHRIEASEKIPAAPLTDSSNKSGKHSGAIKLSASRPEFAGRSRPVAGATGKQEQSRAPQGVPAARIKGKRA